MTPTKPAGEIPTNVCIISEYRGLVNSAYMETLILGCIY